MEIALKTKELETLFTIYIDNNSIEQKRYEVIARSIDNFIQILQKEPSKLQDIFWVSTDGKLSPK
jgi:hypothetical protein